MLGPEALEALRGCAHIIHAGDIDGAAILDALREIAPVTAVRGNNDRVEAKRLDAVIAGHSHKPVFHLEDGVLYVNPGSAGPRRFKLPISLGFLHVAGSAVRAELRTLS